MAQPINFTSPARVVPLHLRMRLCTVDFFSINALLHADTQDLALPCAVLCCATTAVPKDMQLARRIRGPIAGVASF